MSDSIPTVSRPSKTWTLGALEKYALSRADEIGNFGRKTLERTWLLGEALFFIRESLKEKGQWMKWVETQTFSLSTATNAIKAFERVTFDELKKFDGMTASDMKVALDIIKMPSPSKKHKEEGEKLTPNAPEVATDATTDDAPQKATDATTDDAPQKATDTTTDDAPQKATDEITDDAPEKASDRRVTITGPSRNGDQRPPNRRWGLPLMHPKF